MVNQYFYPKLFKVCHYKMKISVISNGRRPRSPKSRPSTLRSNPGRISTSLKINTEPRYFSIKVIRRSNKKIHNLITKWRKCCLELIVGINLPVLKKCRRIMKLKIMMAKKQKKEEILRKREWKSIFGMWRLVLKISKNPSINPCTKRI